MFITLSKERMGFLLLSRCSPTLIPARSMAISISMLSFGLIHPIWPIYRATFADPVTLQQLRYAHP